MVLRSHGIDIKVRTMPYMEMIRQLQNQLDRTSNRQKRQELETQIVILLGLVDVMEKVDNIIALTTEYMRLKA